MEAYQVKSKDIKSFIEQFHYSHKCAPIMYAYALIERNELVGAVTFGMSASPYVAISIRGNGNIPVLELNRLAIITDEQNAASYLIGYAIRHLPKNILLVSYADTYVGHIGYVYQATNWHYAGMTQARTDIDSGNKHARHHNGDPTKRKQRYSKHRYWIGTSKKIEKMSNWKILPYPKGITTRHGATNV